MAGEAIGDRRQYSAQMHRRVTISVAAVALALAACSSGDDAVNSQAAAAATSIAAATATTVASASATDPPATDSVPTDPPVKDPPPTQPSTTDAEAPSTINATAGRPYDVFVPTGYDAATPTPLMLLLHGYGANGDIQEGYFEFEPLAESRGFLYVHPDGTVDAGGNQFWNATDACCAFGGDSPDDSAYLMAIIDEVSADYNVDPSSIFLAGHSNGGFMSYRMACQHADTIAAIASLAGATFADPADCTPSEPVSVLQVHGTDDRVISYGGGSFRGGGIHPGARQTADRWAASNGCAPTPTINAEALDFDGGIDGTDTDVEVFTECEQGSAIELWTIGGGSHIPDVTREFSAGVVDFLLAHPKP